MPAWMKDTQPCTMSKGSPNQLACREPNDICMLEKPIKRASA